MDNAKVYVGVSASFEADGRMFPKALTWEDGTVYEVDRVLDICQAAAMKAGGQGDRYTVSIRGQNSYLYFERNSEISGNKLGRWFVVRR